MIIKSIQNFELFQQVVEAAKQDGHSLVAPTHVVCKDNEIVGAISMLPTALIWTNSKTFKVRDTLMLEAQLSSALAMQGAKIMCIPCTKTSPYFEFLSRDNFINLGDFNLFVKGL